MKTTLRLIILLLFCLSCKRENPKQVHKTISEVVYDTIRVEVDSINKMNEQREVRYRKMPMAELIDSLKMLSSNRVVVELKESESLFGPYKKMDKFYQYNIPRSIYKRIFPEEEISISKEKIKDKKVDEVNKKVYLNYKTKVEEERIYIYLYSVVEKNNYLQLLFTKQGKYNPELELITVSKSNLEKLGNLNLFGGIYDSYDIDYWYSEFVEDYEKIKLTHVKNLSFKAVNLDTSYLEYRITEEGKILKN